MYNECKDYSTEELIVKEPLNVNEVLSAEDRSKITHWIGYYGNSYGDYHSSFAGVDVVLQNWAKYKATFYHMFGEQLILSRPIDYNCPKQRLRQAMYTQMTMRQSRFIRDLSHVFKDYENPLYKALRDAGITFDFFDEDLVDLLIENRWPHADVRIPLPDGKFYVIKHGMRVTRAFQKIAEMNNIEGFESIRELHAKISTSKHMHGTMCLSIHPLDFMTMSDNEEGWDSCMNWCDKGDYRSGTVEMMNSPFIIEAYMPSPDHELGITYNEKWNSKIWRELYIVTPDLISNIRAYPFIDSGLSDFVITWIKELAENYHLGTYCSNIIEYDSEYGETFPICMYTNNMYNDYNRETQRIYFSTEFAQTYANTSYRLNYSGPMSCMNCGEEMSSCLEYSQIVSCPNCSEPEEYSCVCDCCNNSIPEEYTYEVDDTLLCQDCYNDPDIVVYTFDDKCMHMRNNCTEIRIGNSNMDWNIMIYDLPSWVRHNTLGITKDSLKYYTRPSRYWVEGYYVLPVEYANDDMARELGYENAECLRETYQRLNAENPYNEEDDGWVITEAHEL